MYVKPVFYLNAPPKPGKLFAEKEPKPGNSEGDGSGSEGPVKPKKRTSSDFGSSSDGSSSNGADDSNGYLCKGIGRVVTHDFINEG